MMELMTGASLALRGWFLALMVMPAPLADAGGRDVAVVVRADVPVYGRFAERFQAACDCAARVVALQGDPNRVADEVRAMRPGAVLAVGRSGLRLVAGRLGDLPLVHALTLNPQTLLPPGLGGAPGAPLNVASGPSLALLKRISPRIQRVAVVHDPRRTSVAEAARAARDLGMELEAFAVSDVSGALQAARKAMAGADAVLLLPDRTALVPEVLDHILLQGLERRIPVIGFADKHVRRGALLARSATPDQVALEAARLVERVLAGDRRPTLGPRDLSLALNLRTAARLGLTVPDDVRRGAHLLVR